MMRGGKAAAILVSALLHLGLVVAFLWNAEATLPEPEPVEAVEVELVPPPQATAGTPEAPPPAPPPTAGEPQAPEESTTATLPEGEAPEDVPPPVPVIEGLGAPTLLDGPLPEGAPGEEIAEPRAEESKAAEAPAEPPPELPVHNTEPAEDATPPAAADAAERAAEELQRDAEAAEAASTAPPPATPAEEGETEAQTDTADAPPAAVTAAPESDPPAPIEEPARSETPAEPQEPGEPQLSDRAPGTRLAVPVRNPRREAVAAGVRGGEGAVPGNKIAYTQAVRSAIAPGFIRAMRTVQGRGTAVVEVVIERSGAVRSARIFDSSGDPALDAASLTAARTAPFPPLPSVVDGDSLTVQIPLRVR